MNMSRGTHSLTFAVASALAISALIGCSGTGGAGSENMEPLPSASSASKSAGHVGAATASESPAPAPSIVAAAPADSFVDSIGADTHFGYGGTSYVTNFTAISAALIASGIRHIRDGEPNDPHAQALTYLGQNGVRHSVIFPVTTTATQITGTIDAYQPYVDFVEPQNEYDEDPSGGSNWAAQIVSEQKLLYATVRANSAYAGIRILGPSFGHPYNASATGPLDAYEDDGNMHDYPCNLNPGTASGPGLANITSLLRAATAQKPIATTEVGYSDNPAGWTCGLSDSVIAKFDPRAVGERWIAGEPLTYFYQFADMGPYENYNGMGLVSAAGAPKAQYTTLQSMIGLLSDRGPGFTARGLGFTLTGNTTNVHQVLLQKRDGSYYLLLWLEVAGWNATSGEPLTVDPQAVSVSLVNAPSSVTQYSYAASGALIGASLPASKNVAISVTDSITFIHLTF